jgi:hypothetical protein
MNEFDEKQARLNALRELLSRYDYIGTKIATGRATKEEYADEIARMTAWAEEINALEAEIAAEREE